MKGFLMIPILFCFLLFSSISFAEVDRFLENRVEFDAINNLFKDKPIDELFNHKKEEIENYKKWVKDLQGRFEKGTYEKPEKQDLMEELRLVTRDLQHLTLIDITTKLDSIKKLTLYGKLIHIIFDIVSGKHGVKLPSITKNAFAKEDEIKDIVIAIILANRSNFESSGVNNLSLFLLEPLIEKKYEWKGTKISFKDLIENDDSEDVKTLKEHIALIYTINFLTQLTIDQEKASDGLIEKYPKIRLIYHDWVKRVKQPSEQKDKNHEKLENTIRKWVCDLFKIGDDSATDETFEKLHTFCQNVNFFKLYDLVKLNTKFAYGSFFAHYNKPFKWDYSFVKNYDPKQSSSTKDFVTELDSYDLFREMINNFIEHDFKSHDFFYMLEPTQDFDWVTEIKKSQSLEEILKKAKVPLTSYKISDDFKKQYAADISRIQPSALSGPKYTDISDNLKRFAQLLHSINVILLGLYKKSQDPLFKKYTIDPFNSNPEVMKGNLYKVFGSMKELGYLTESMKKSLIDFYSNSIIQEGVKKMNQSIIR